MEFYCIQNEKVFEGIMHGVTDVSSLQNVFSIVLWIRTQSLAGLVVC